MTERKAPAKQPGDIGADEVQKAVAEEMEKGYSGQVPPQPPNEAYSLQSGPDSPGAFDVRRHQLEADLDEMKKEA